MVEAFCVLSTRRTGSGHLCSLLDSHPQICCHHELFDRVDIDAVPVGPVLDDRDWREREPLGWLKAVIAASSAHDPRWRAVGFKLHFPQRPSVLERILLEPGFAVLLLDRADRLAQYASRKIADETRQFTSRGSEATQSLTVPFDRAGFEVFVRQHEDLYGMARAVLRGRGDVLELDYEILSDPETHRHILGFLGVDATVSLTAPERKQNPSDVLARFSNPDEVVAALRQTPWAAWLPDGSGR